MFNAKEATYQNECIYMKRQERGHLKKRVYSLLQ